MDKEANRFGRWLKNQISESNLTNHTTADYIGVSESTIENHISGKYFPPMHIILRYGEFFMIDPLLLKKMIDKDLDDLGYSYRDYIGGIYK